MLKKNHVRNDDDISLKFGQDAQILKSRVSVSEFLMKSRSRARLEILTSARARSQSLRSRLHHRQWP